MAFPDDVDTLQEPGANLASPPHDELHEELRTGLLAVQEYLLEQIPAIVADAWVSTARLANLSVTDAKIASVSPGKLTSTLFASLSTVGNVTTGGYVRAGDQGHNPGFRIQRYGGTLDATFGAAAVGHNIVLAHLRVVLAQAWYEGGAGEAVPLAVNYIDGDTFAVAPVGTVGDEAGAQWRGVILYTEDSPAW